MYFNSVKCELDFNYNYQRNNKKNVITIYITKRLSHFGKVTMSVGKIIDELLFGENEKKSSFVNTGANHTPCLNHFETFRSRVILTQSVKGKKITTHY